MAARTGMLGLCVLLCSAFNLANATITEVVVYPQGAQIKDERTVDLKAGENELAWSDLSQSVNTRSLRVSGPVRVVDFSFEKVQTTVEQSPKRGLLEDKMRVAQARLDEISDRLDIIAKKDAYLTQIQQSSTMPVKGESAYNFPQPTQWQNLIEFLASARAVNQKDHREAVRAQELAQKELDGINQEIAELDNVPTTFTQALTLKVNSPKAQRTTLTLSYFDTEAHWYPAYEVWVDASTKAVQLSYIAFVRQSTNNDWKNVELTLSTARPRFSSGVPELTPWWVREHQEVVVRQMMANANMQEASMDAVARKDSYKAKAMALGAAMPAPTTVQQGMTFAQFKVSAKSSISGSGATQRILVAEVPLKGELVYKVVPELSTDAYLEAKVANTSDYTLLHGDSQLYNDGNYVGSGHLKLAQPGEIFDLDLGIDPAIKVERKLLSHKTEDSGILQDNKKIIFSYSLELTNLKKSPQTVQIMEHLPISQHDKIKVELIEPKDMGKNIDKEGKLTWDLTLSAGQKLVLPLIYSVEFPKKMQVDGL